MLPALDVSLPIRLSALPEDVPSAAVEYAEMGFRPVPVYGLTDRPHADPARGRACMCPDPRHDGQSGGARCSSPGKHPVGNEWQKRATSDPRWIEARARANPGCNVGLAMGGPERLIALDIDGAEGRASLDKLEGQHGALPATLTSRSGRPDGGEHRIFRVPEAWDLAAVKNRAGALGPGIDVRGEGGQIVVAPSAHASGGRYAWTVTAPPAEMTRWLYELAAADKKASNGERRTEERPGGPGLASAQPRRSDRHPWVQAAIDGACADVAAASMGTRDDAANTAGYALGGLVASGHIGEREAFDLLLAACRDGGWDVTDHGKTAGTLRRAIASGQKAPRQIPSKSRAFDGATRGGSTGEIMSSGIDGSGPGAEVDAAVDPPPPPPPRRPAIQIVTGELPRMVQESIAALAEDANLYQRAGELVTVTREPERADYDRDVRQGADVTMRPGTPRLRQLASPVLVERLATVATWQRWKADKDAEEGAPQGEWVPADPPGRIASIVAARGDWPGIRPIRGIIEAPSLRPDGTVIDRAGYDAATGYVLLPSCDFPAVPDAPSQADAAEALRRLWIELFCDFPFQGIGEADPADVERLKQYERARTIADAFVGIAALLTIVARPAILGAVPCAIFEAAAQGSGKTLQIHALSVASTGRPAGVMTFPAGRGGEPNEEELEKVLAAYALAGSRVVAFDNVKCTLGGPSLEKVTTAVDSIDLRILGQSELRTMPWGAVVLFSGNNLTMSDDIAQRGLVSRLESPREDPRGRPEQTFYRPDLLSSVRAIRPSLIRDALLVLRALMVTPEAQRPAADTWGSFEPWAKLIPPAIVHAGGPNVLAARPKVGEQGLDAEGEAHAALLRGWPCAEPARAADVLRALAFDKEYDMAHGKEAPDGREDARAAARTLTRCGEGRVPNVIAFGKAIGRLRGKIRQGMKLTARSHRTGVLEFFVDSGPPVPALAIVQPAPPVEPSNEPTSGVDDDDPAEDWDR